MFGSKGPGLAVEGVRDVDARIAGLLGLGFDHFTRTVVLPQGRFAAFLEDGPAARERLLKQLLDLGVRKYEEMRKRRRVAPRSVSPAGRPARCRSVEGRSTPSGCRT
jgi:DNA repair protein SbcC/Rad50